MGEIVDDRHASLDSPDFHPALDSAEGFEPFLDGGGLDPAKMSDSDVGQRVGHVVPAAQRAGEAKPVLSFQPGREAGGLRRIFNVGRVKIALPVKSEREPPGSGVLLESTHIRVPGVGHDQVPWGHLLDTFPERVNDRFEIGVDVGVIEFDVVEDERAGAVVKKLGPLVEKGRVVLVAFDDEIRTITKLEVAVEVPKGA